MAILGLLHYAGPPAVLVYFVVTSLWSILTLQTLDVIVRKSHRSFVCNMSLLVCLLYVKSTPDWAFNVHLLSFIGKRSIYHHLSDYP